jgi:hypothetical protein
MVRARTRWFRQAMDDIRKREILSKASTRKDGAITKYLLF